MPHAPTSKPHASRSYRSLIVLAATACVSVTAACGSSSKPNGATGPNGATQGIKYAACLRANGVPDFPDPGGGGGGFQIPAGSGINPQSPAFKSAQQACKRLLSAAIGPLHPSQQRKTQMLEISECMRRRGISGFPDPKLSPPSSPAGYSALQDRDGVVLAIPDTINVASPAFKRAASACGFSA